MKNCLFILSAISLLFFTQCESEEPPFVFEDDFPLNWNDYPKADMDEEMISYFAVGGEGLKFICQNMQT